jgi:hypothetical protein
MNKAVVGAVALFFSPLITAAHPQALPLPPALIDLRSNEGGQFLRETESYAAYLHMSATFVTQKNQAYCGIASMVMILNAAQVPAPAQQEYLPYHTFTQDNVLNERTDVILPRAVLNRQGTTLDQLGDMLRLYPLNVEPHHATDGGLDEFRKLASTSLAQSGHFVIVNYLRVRLGQEAGGHISPLAAYDAKSDRFLILDVARYKYPPVWVTTEDLYKAMNTTDADNDGKHRGYVLVSVVTPSANETAH